MKHKTHEVLFRLKNMKVYFRLLMLLLFCSMQVPASSKNPVQQQIVKGTVKDNETGEALTGVSIFLEGSKSGTITDANGNFSIKIQDAKSVLKLSYIGYTTQRVTVKEQTMLKIMLVPDSKQWKKLL